MIAVAQREEGVRVTGGVNIWIEPPTDLPIDRMKSVRCPRTGCNQLFVLGDVGDGAEIEHICRRCRKPFSLPGPVPIDAITKRGHPWKCPNCNETFCSGQWGRGALVEHKCRRCDRTFTIRKT